MSTKDFREYSNGFVDDKVLKKMPEYVVSLVYSSKSIDLNVFDRIRVGKADAIEISNVSSYFHIDVMFFVSMNQLNQVV